MFSTEGRNNFFGAERSAGTPCHQDEYGVASRLNIIRSELELQPVKICLDSGCGYGAYLRNLAFNSNLVIGININYKFLEIAKENRNPRVHLSQMSLQNIGLADATINLIICMETLEHVNNDEKVIEEFRRLIEPGGKLKISVPYKWFPFETHGIRILKRMISSPIGLGFPFLSFIPCCLRASFATAKVYSKRRIVNLLCDKGFAIKDILFLMPAMDVFERKIGSVVANLIRRFLYWIQSKSFTRWGSTILIIAHVR